MRMRPTTEREMGLGRIELDLFPTPPPKLPAIMSSSTSRAAAKRERVRQGAFRWEVLLCFVDGEKSDNDLYILYPNAKEGTVRARRNGLVADGYLKPDGIRNNCTEWSLTKLGWEKCQELVAQEQK